MISLLVLACFFGMAQTEDENNKEKLNISGHVDMYYLYSFNQPYVNDYSAYAYAYHRHNEINLNNGYLKASYENGKIFGNLSLQTGTYSRANYAAEPSEYRAIAEASLGFKATDKLTIDAGVMPSHIGVESATGSNCYNITRSLMADASPYFLTGVRAKYQFNDKWDGALWITNGWQIINETNSDKAVGARLTYTPSERISFNYSNFYGNEQPDNAPVQMWYFHDMSITITDLFENFHLTLVTDQMYQQKLVGSGTDNLTVGAILGYYEMEKFNLGFRLEHYNDPHEIVQGTGIINSIHGFQTSGGSVNVDVPIGEKMLWRVEGRIFDSKESIFITDNPTVYSSQLSFVATSLSISF